MDSIFTVATDGEAPDRWRCTSHSYDEFQDAESAGNLGKAMALWHLLTPSNGKKARGSATQFEGPPMRGSRDTAPESLQFEDLNSPPSAHLLGPHQADAYEADVSMPSPYQFTWSAPGRGPVQLGKLKSAILQKALTWDLFICKELAHPFYHRIEQQIDNVVDRYMRLMLPVADSQGRVCAIYAFCRPLAPYGNQEQQQAINLI